MKIQMDKTTDTFIIVKSGQDATPLAGSNSLAFPGSGAGLSGCEIPPGEASEKGIGKSEEVGCASAGSSSLVFPGSGVGIPGCGVPLRGDQLFFVSRRRKKTASGGG